MLRRLLQIVSPALALAFVLAMIVALGGAPSTTQPASAALSTGAHHLAAPIPAAVGPVPAALAVAAPAAVGDPAPAVLSRTGWTVVASDQETAAINGAATNVLDGNTATYWFSKYKPSVVGFPHSLSVDMKSLYKVSSFTYLPRPASLKGRIGTYAIAVSTDGATWSAPVATGTFADTAGEKTVTFAAVSARYIRLTATSEAANRCQCSNAAEINVVGVPDTAPAPPAVLSRAGWTVAASDQETVAVNGAAANVLDGSPGTYWYSKYKPTVVGFPHSLSIDMKTTKQVSGMTYLAQAGTVKGRIGAYSISVSADGTNWGTPVARGTFADTAAQKTVSFTAVTARYIRLTATSEAANRCQCSNAAEINVIGTTGTTTPTDPTTPTTPTTPPEPSKGVWGSKIDFPLVPVAAAVLPGNKMLTWSAWSNVDFGGANGTTQTAILDLNTGTVSQRTVASTGHDMFCPGISMLPDGRVMITGGSNAAETTFYNPTTNTWTAGPKMNIPRGYHSTVTLATGEVLAIGGSWSGDTATEKTGEVWSAANGWRSLTGVGVDPIMTDDPRGAYRADNHTWLFPVSGGRIFHAGPSKQMNWITTAGAGSITSAGLRADSGDAMNGNAVMYDIDKIVTMGGAPTYEDSYATARAYTIDVRNGAVAQRTGDLAFPRSFANAVALPDGKVFVAGGQAWPRPFTDNAAALSPEIWDPATGKFTTLTANAIPRTYHSIATLLPDARVFVGGGGLCGNCGDLNHLDGEIFSPPYLLNSDGTAKTRPAIVTSPATANRGTSISVTTDSATTSYSLVRMSTVTHTVNTDQRRIPLTRTGGTGNTATLALPADAGVLLPGNYMLFAMNADGVPSIAKDINIR